MYEIILNHKFEEIGMFQNHAKRQYRTLGAISANIDGTLKIERVAKREEWRLLWSADYREIGRVRKVKAPAPAITPRPVRFRDVVRNVGVAALTLIGLTLK